MRRKEFAAKVRGVRDSIMEDIRDLSEDKENLMSNVKNIKELTSILRELDKMTESDGEDRRVEQEFAREDFFEKIRKQAEIVCEEE